MIETMNGAKRQTYLYAGSDGDNATAQAVVAPPVVDTAPTKNAAVTP
jgi:hypothetical protein